MSKKINQYFTCEFRNCLDLFTTPMPLKTCSAKYVATALSFKWNCSVGLCKLSDIFLATLKTGGKITSCMFVCMNGLVAFV